MGEPSEVTGRGARAFLIGISLVMATGAAWFLLDPPETGSEKTQSNLPLLVTRIEHHPTDWPAASALTEVALDARNESRVALWRAAYDHASRLAPERKDPPTAFVRSGFFHWSELSEGDQQAVLSAASGLLRNPAFFGRMARPIYELTGDLTFLERSGPQTADTIASLITFSLMNDRFAEYRALRSELQRRRNEEIRNSASSNPEDLFEQLPLPPYHQGEEPLIRSTLEALHVHPLTDVPRRQSVAEALIDYALRHQLGPLDGLEILSRKPGAVSTKTQVRLAEALGLKERAVELEMASHDPRTVANDEHEWQEGCGKEICYRAWRMVDASRGIDLELQSVPPTDSSAYVEIYLDDALEAEGEVGKSRHFIIPVGKPGSHRLEIVLVNPTSRNLSPRKVQASAIRIL